MVSRAPAQGFRSKPTRAVRASTALPVAISYCPVSVTAGVTWNPLVSEILTDPGAK